ncbi:hypothetical protein AB2M16_08805 [Acetobacter oryzifermentans]|uniref:hypothetical protein n=1 Tax=Acetobacter oryzifermentans TaxID=1633874 RepID=UPI003463BD65
MANRGGGPAVWRVPEANHADFTPRRFLSIFYQIKSEFHIVMLFSQSQDNYLGQLGVHTLINERYIDFCYHMLETDISEGYNYRERSFAKKVFEYITENEEAKLLFDESPIETETNTDDANEWKRTLFLISADRLPKSYFNYTYFYILLKVIDTLNGGRGLIKPVKQVRVLQWNGTEINLVHLLVMVGRTFPSVRAHAILSVPYIHPANGIGLDHSFH